MYLYVVRKIENGSFSKIHCERFLETEWEEIRKTINPQSIVLVTANIEELKQFTSALNALFLIKEICNFK